MGLKYNEELVAQGLLDFTNKNPEASGEAIAAKEKELIIREATVALWMDYYKRFPDDSIDPITIESELRNGKHQGASKTRKLFNEMGSPKWETNLESLQKLSAEDKTGRVLPDFRDSFSTSIHNGLDYKDEEKLKVGGDEYVKGLFAPVTDPSGMLFDGIKENSTFKKQSFRQKQVEADGIKIDVPADMDAGLVTFTVMGEFFKSKHLEQLSNTIKKGGSTLPDSFSTTENVMATFFENTIKSEPRANMHACRLTIPEVRRAAKELIESGNKEGIRDNLKRSFDLMYIEAMSLTDIDKMAYPFAVRNALVLVDSVKKSNIDPESLGITEEKINMLSAAKKIIDFKIETATLRKKLTDKYEELYFSGELNKPDFAFSPEMQEQMLELLARHQIISGIKDDLTRLHALYEMYGIDEADSRMATRDLTEAEKRIIEDKEVLLDETVEKLKKGDAKKNYDAMIKNPEKRYQLLLYGIEKIEPVYEEHCQTGVFIEKIQDDLLKNLESYVVGKPGGGKVMEAIADVRKVAAWITPDSRWEKLALLEGPYMALYKATRVMQEHIEPQDMMKKENLLFIGSSDRIDNLIKEIRKHPGRREAQAEFERSRKALHESVKNDELKYDHEKAEERMKEFRDENPNATRAQLVKAENDIILDEAIIYSKLSAYEKFEPDIKDLLDFQKKEDSIREEGKNIESERIILSFLEGEAKLRFVKAYQQNMAKTENVADLKKLDRCLFKLKGANPEESRNKVNGPVDKVFNALFAPKTDNSGIRMSGFKMESATINKEAILRWQDETDKIEIPVPKNMDKSLVSFMVFGRATKDDLLQEAYRYGNDDGSTLAKNFDIGNAQVLFWDNLMKNDERCNTHCIRGVVPKARREVKQMLESGNEEGIKQCLKNAFDVMYRQVLLETDHDSLNWHAPMQKLTRFLDVLEKSGIPTQSLGIEPEKVEKFNSLKPVFNMVKEKFSAEATLRENAFRYFESGFAPEYDPVNDARTRALLEKHAALRHGIDKTSNDVRRIKGLYNWMSLEEVDELFKDRELTINEKRCADNPEDYLEFITREIRDEFKTVFKGTKNGAPEKMELCLSGIRPKNMVYTDQPEYEKVAMPHFLDEMKNSLALEMFNIIPGIDVLRTKTDELIALRRAAGDNYTQEVLESFILPYEELAKLIRKFEDSVPPELDRAPEVQKITKVAGILHNNAYCIIKEPERKQQLAKENAELKEVSSSFQPTFVERYAGYRSALEEIGPGSQHRAEYNAMMDAMDRLTGKLDGLCGEKSDKNAIFSRSDAKELKSMFALALKGCTDYINVSGKNALEDDRVFMATELQSQLARNIAMFEKLPETNAITLSDAIKSRYGEPVRDEDIIERFSTIAEKLEAVGSRFGGNSDEFERMKEALTPFKTGNIEAGQIDSLTDALEIATNAYVGEKRVIPSTEKGKRRLQLAREISDLCRDIKQAKKWEYFGQRQKDTNTYSENLKADIEKRRSASVDGLRNAVRNMDKEGFTKKCCELIYLGNVEKKLGTEGDAAAEYLKADAVEQGAGKLNRSVSGMLEVCLKKELKDILTSPNAPERLEKLYLGYTADVRKKGGMNADRSDTIIASNRPNLE